MKYQIFAFLNFHEILYRPTDHERCQYFTIFSLNKLISLADWQSRFVGTSLRSPTTPKNLRISPSNFLPTSSPKAPLLKHLSTFKSSFTCLKLFWFALNNEWLLGTGEVFLNPTSFERFSPRGGKVPSKNGTGKTSLLLISYETDKTNSSGEKKEQENEIKSFLQNYNQHRYDQETWIPAAFHRNGGKQLIDRRLRKGKVFQTLDIVLLITPAVWNAVL